jgi:hypothetical protein
LFAAGCSLQYDGKEQEAKSVFKLLDSSQKDSVVPYSADKAGCNLYPSYNDIKEAKNRCMAISEDSIEVTDYSASVNLHKLLYHTASCLVDMQKDWFLWNPNIQKYTLCYKIGFDGATGQSIYKQISTDNEEHNIKQEECLFFTCIVPLELSGFNGSVKNFVWLNPKCIAAQHILLLK